MTRARSDVASLVTVAGVHLVIGGVHQYAHAVAEVKISSLQVLEANARTAGLNVDDL